MENNTPNKKLLIKAHKVVTTYNNYSISFLQRKLGIGYNTATILINILKKDNM
jgi:DNA segregation ATPase FtsK/SpoIIIE-like protein